MRIEIKKFGSVLTSRQSGREAYAAFLPTLNKVPEGEFVQIDFSDVLVMSPSWADEFLTPLLDLYGSNLELLPSDNASVAVTIETIEEILGRKFNKK